MNISWQPNFYSVALIISAALALGGAAVASQRRGNPGAHWMTYLTGSIAIWSFFYAFELAIGDLDTQVLMAKIEYIGVSTASTFWFFFALTYSGYNPTYRRNRLPLILIASGIFLALAWTNERHGLIWSGFEQVVFDGMKILIVQHGPAFWGLVAYSYVMILAGSIVFVRQALKSRKAYGAQSLAILFAVAITWIGNLLYNTGLNPFPYLDLTPFAMTIAGLVCIAGLMRLGPLDLFPVVSETVLESMSDGVLVLDGTNRAIYGNHVFRTRTMSSNSSPAGQTFDELFREWPGFAQTYRNATDSHASVELPAGPSSPLYFDMRISIVRGRKGQPVGRIFIFHDVTERKQAELQMASEASRNAAQHQESAIPMVLVFRYKDGKIIEVNRAFILSLGYTREETVGRTLIEMELWTPEQRARFMRQLVSTNQVEDYLLELRRKDGRPQEYLLTASRLETKKEMYVTWLAFEKS